MEQRTETDDRFYGADRSERPQIDAAPQPVNCPPKPLMLPDQGQRLLYGAAAKHVYGTRRKPPGLFEQERVVVGNEL